MSDENDTLWGQVESLMKFANKLANTINKLAQQQSKLNQRIRRLEDKESFSPIRVTLEFRNVQDAEEFKEYVKDQNDVAIPRSDRMQDDKFIPATVVED